MDYILYDEINKRIENLEKALKLQTQYNNEVLNLLNMLFDNKLEPTYGPMMEEGEEHS